MCEFTLSAGTCLLLSERKKHELFNDEAQNTLFKDPVRTAL
jgi:hypothetical protein